MIGLGTTLVHKRFYRSLAKKGPLTKERPYPTFGPISCIGSKFTRMGAQPQGVVTYMSPVEAFATGIKIFDRQKVCLIALSVLLRPLITWFITGQRSNCSHAFLVLDFRSSEVPLIGSQNWVLWSLDSILIPVANASCVKTPLTLERRCELCGEFEKHGLERYASCNHRNYVCVEGRS